MKVAIIPARGGSTRIPRKNIRSFHGKPIIAYSIEAAKKSALFGWGQIIVSTDDKEIAQVCERLDVSVHLRPQALGANDVGTQEVARDALVALERAGKHIDYACCIYATAPLMSARDIVRGLDLLQEYGSAFAFSVGTEPLHDPGQFYWGRTRAFVDRTELYSHQAVMVPIEAKRCCDINTEEDWARAERMYEALAGEETHA